MNKIILDTDYGEGSKGCDMVKEIGYMVETGVVTKDEYDEFVCDALFGETILKTLAIDEIDIYIGV